MRKSASTILMLGLVATMLCAPARRSFAQDAAASANGPTVVDDSLRLEPVDQRVGDMGGISAGQRFIQPGLQRPTGFEQVYRAPGQGNGFFRADGALFALFDHSIYGYAPGGRTPMLVPYIPAGTVFHIGSPFGGMTSTGGASPTATAMFQTTGRLQQRLDGRALDELIPTGFADTRVRDGDVTDNSISSDESPEGAVERTAPQARALRTHYDTTVRTVVTDDDYRADRLRALMHRAAGATSEASDDQAARGPSSDD